MFRSSLAAGAALACTAVPSHGADWRLAGLALGEGNRGITYVDVTSVRDVRGKVRFRADQHLERPENGTNRILSVAVVDCARMTVTVLRAQYFKGNGLIGMVNVPREDNVYSSATSDHWVARRVCNRDFPAGPISDRVSAAALMFAADWAPLAERLALQVPQGPGRVMVASVSAQRARAAAPR